MRDALTDPTSRGLTRDRVNLKEVPLSELDILITGGRVADGTGAPSTIQNVGVKDGSIAYLGEETPGGVPDLDTVYERVPGADGTGRIGMPLCRANIASPSPCSRSARAGGARSRRSCAGSPRGSR